MLSNSPSTRPISTRATNPSPVESQEVVVKPFNRPQPEPRIPTLSGREEPNDDIPEIYPHLEERHESPLSQSPKKKRIGLRGAVSGRLSSFFLPMFKSSGKTRDDHRPLSLAEIIAESRRRPDQNLIDRVDRVSSSASEYLCTRLTRIPDAGHY